MLSNFQLAAIVGKSDDELQVLRIPLNQGLQSKLASSWGSQLDEFVSNAHEIRFNAGYQPEEHERFGIADYQLPTGLAGITSASAASLDAIGTSVETLSMIRGIIGFARLTGNVEVVLFQNFNRSHVIAPGRFLLLRKGIYETTEQPGLRLENRLAAVFTPKDGKLLFRNFRSVNTFLPLSEFFEEASEEQIREVLCHERLAPVSVEALAVEASQWFRKRFSMLRASGVLDKFTPKEIQARAKGYDVQVKISKGRIVFPEEKMAAKKLLQFLNEEIFRGAITEILYETNSKRQAD